MRRYRNILIVILLIFLIGFISLLISLRKAQLSVEPLVERVDSYQNRIDNVKSKTDSFYEQINEVNALLENDLELINKDTTYWKQFFSNKKNSKKEYKTILEPNTLPDSVLSYLLAKNDNSYMGFIATETVIKKFQVYSYRVFGRRAEKIDLRTGYKFKNGESLVFHFCLPERLQIMNNSVYLGYNLNFNELASENRNISPSARVDREPFFNAYTGFKKITNRKENTYCYTLFFDNLKNVEKMDGFGLLTNSPINLAKLNTSSYVFVKDIFPVFFNNYDTIRNWYSQIDKNYYERNYDIEKLDTNKVIKFRYISHNEFTFNKYSEFNWHKIEQNQVAITYTDQVLDRTIVKDFSNLYSEHLEQIKNTITEEFSKNGFKILKRGNSPTLQVRIYVVDSRIRQSKIFEKVNPKLLKTPYFNAPFGTLMINIFDYQNNLLWTASAYDLFDGKRVVNDQLIKWTVQKMLNEYLFDSNKSL